MSTRARPVATQSSSRPSSSAGISSSCSRLTRLGAGQASAGPLLRAALTAAGTKQVFTSTNASNQPMRSLLLAEGWSFSGELDGLDEGDPELVFYCGSGPWETMSLVSPPTPGPGAGP